MNGLGQGTFAAALTYSLNIGSTVYEMTKEDSTSNIGPTLLNCLIIQDDNTKMNRTMEDARKGDMAFGRILERSSRKTVNDVRP